MVRPKVIVDEKLVLDLKAFLPEATDSSIRVYALNLTNVAKELGKPLSLELFSDIKVIIDYFKKSEAKNNTIKNKVSAIVNYLKLMKAEKPLVKEYTDYLDSLSIMIGEENVKNVKSIKEDENWMSKADLVKFAKSLKKGLPKVVSDYADLEKWMNYIALNWHINFPTRNELADTAIVSKIKMKTNDPNTNYLLVNSKDKKVEALIQAYKTVKTYDTIDIQIVGSVANDIIKYFTILKKYKKANGITNDWLIISKDGEKLSRNNYTTFVQDIFEPTGKKIGTTMIRKIIASDVYDIKRMNELARIMGHSVEQGMNTYAKL
jgi:site-specific recombinase XerD